MSTKEVTEEIWDHNQKLGKIQEEISKYSLPKKPVSYGQDYLFPEDVSDVTYQDLGKWLLKLAAWKGYTFKMLALSETEMIMLDGVCDASVAKKIAMSDREGKKITKDLALGIRLEEPEFKKTKTRLMEKESETAGLKRIAEIYTMQMEAISREISRRVSEMKTFQRGVE